MNNYTVLFSLLFLISCSGSAPAQSAAYKLSIDESDKKNIRVEANFILQDSILYMSPNGPMPERWPDYVNTLELRNSNGGLLPVSQVNNHWTTTAGTGQSVTLSYRVSLTHSDQEWPGGIDGVAFVTDWGQFFTGRTIFVMNGDERSTIEVQFNVPENWEVSTPWKRSAGDNHNFELFSHQDLTESLIMAGQHKQLTVSKDKLKLQFVLGGKGVIRQQERFKKLAQQTMNYYLNMMGGAPLPQTQNSNTIMVAINEADQVDGEVIGSHISMLLDPQSSPRQQMVGWFMFAHEFFHLWNGKSITVKGTKEDWFKEGITNYYTLKALYQVGFINEEALTGVLNGLFYQRYRADSGLDSLSMREAASGFDKDNHWGLIYGGGLFAGIALDMMIRESTNNRKSLDDLMRQFYKTYAGSDETYTTGDVLSAVNRLSGADLSPFFKTHIYGTEPIPVERYLSKAGYSVTIQNGQLMAKPKTDMSELERNIHKGFLGNL